ncbi:hypothetical protein SARC_02258 [Sphaeroforma arctica JP610]|uniref:Uncharacterized protein n=1 Tax=Sphaeroforma arctica JP610 TaxID=667725 RepID=A0A0L0G9J9_9EUKA|nr:hypothetical protein SARC_02258 [Sphaeroforma arctica JP610]KNC85569.1 hypothetical protein SARC_02258 [Sphaeroforma arctica JP610]|eukprot:XP_014159471.1 hypothetical protein SARC_02258 [Sphaeroforma arctica JP610]
MSYPALFTKHITEAFDTVDIDLFADAKTAQAPIYCSLEPNAPLHDAFEQSWKQDRKYLYGNIPFHSKTTWRESLLKLERKNELITMIFPVIPGQRNYKQILLQLNSHVEIIRTNEHTFLQNDTNVTGPLSKWRYICLARVGNTKYSILPTDDLMSAEADVVAHPHA